MAERRVFGIRRIAVCCAAAAIAFLVHMPARADTVASLLGNFTINQYSELAIDADSVDIHYAVVYGQLPALKELHAADSNGDGITSQSERDAYVGTLAPSFADALELTVDGVAVPLHATRWRSSLPTEQGGFSLRVDVDFAAALAPLHAGAKRTLQFSNLNYRGRIGWREIVVKPAKDIAVFDTDAFSTSATAGLTEALQSLPAAGPLDERAVHMSVGSSMPPSAAALEARPLSSLPVVRAAPPSSEAAWIALKTKQLVDAISAPHLNPRIAVLAVLAALVLGSIHALSPGHGKTIVGAYLIGSRGTPRHAAFLGLTVTVTHTIGVFALGFATLYASKYFVPEKLFPILNMVSALLVLGMGAVLLVQRGRAAVRSARGVPMFLPVEAARTGPGSGYGLLLAPSAALAHDGLMHSHGGGPMHSHLPPGTGGERITWKSLLTLGISGGLVPCPSAMVLLLAAIALNKTAYGMLLVLVFSVGLAITLTVVGLAFLYARNRFSSHSTGRWQRWLPTLSAAAITVVGAALCYGALKSFS